MSPGSYIKERQRLWAMRRGLGFNKQFRTARCADNLFEPLSEEAAREFAEADGNETAAGGKMSSLHSSSALCCNVFHYPHRLGLDRELAKACGIPIAGLQSIRFEGKLRITDGPSAPSFPKRANLDVIFDYAPGARPCIVGIESKFCEPFSRHASLSPTYLKATDVWRGLPNVHELADKLARDGGGFIHLDAPQLLKHALALGNLADGRGFRLLCLWYDVPYRESSRLREEITEFQEVFEADGIAFTALTYQEVILALADGLRADHAAYVDYIVERYL